MKKSALLLIGLTNLMSMTSQVFAAQPQKAGDQSANMEKLNLASLNSMENTWLRVPPTCKARAFNASPVTLETTEVAAHIQDLYSSYGI